MADNKTFQSATPATLPANTVAATKEVLFSGNTADVQLIEVVSVTGSEGSRTLNEISDASGLIIQSTQIGSLTETAPATDTASSGLNGRLQRIAQRITSLIALLPTSLGQKAKTASLAVTLASDQDALPITDNSGSLTVDNAGTFAVQVDGNALTSLQLIDDPIATLGTTTYTEATTKGTTIGAVRRDADTTLVDTTNEIGPLQMDANGRLKVEAFSGETLPVSAASLPLPSGASTLAEQQAQTTALAIIAGDTSDIEAAIEILDDWDESDRAKVNIIAGQAGVTAGAGAVAANTQRVTLASDDPAVAALQILDNAISGSEMQVDVVGALPAGTNAIGKLAANSGVDIGDVDIASIAAGDNNIGNVDLASAIPAGTAAIGKLLPPDVDVTTHTNYAKKYYTNAGAVTDGIVWSPAAGKRWHVVSMYLNVSAAATVTLEDDKAGGDEAIWKGEYAANSGVTIYFGEKYPLASGEDAADLIVTTSAGNIYCTVTGYEI
jgi:hypothetical protein